MNTMLRFKQVQWIDYPESQLGGKSVVIWTEVSGRKFWHGLSIIDVAGGSCIFFQRDNFQKVVPIKELPPESQKMVNSIIEMEEKHKKLLNDPSYQKICQNPTLDIVRLLVDEGLDPTAVELEIRNCETDPSWEQLTKWQSFFPTIAVNQKVKWIRKAVTTLKAFA